MSIVLIIFLIIAVIVVIILILVVALYDPTPPEGRTRNVEFRIYPEVRIKNAKILDTYDAGTSNSFIEELCDIRDRCSGYLIDEKTGKKKTIQLSGLKDGWDLEKNNRYTLVAKIVDVSQDSLIGK